MWFKQENMEGSNEFVFSTPTDWDEVLSNGLRDGGGKLSRPLLAN